MKKYIKSLIALACCFAIFASTTVSAITPAFSAYEGYEYNIYDESVSAPIGYLPSGIVSGENLAFSMKTKGFTDICLDSHDGEHISTYLLDGIAGVVYKCDEELNVKSIYSDFKDKNGKKVNLKGATNITNDYDNSVFYVYKNGTVYIINAMSTVVGQFSISGFKSFISLPTVNADATIATTLAVLTSDNSSGVTLYNGEGKKLKFYKLGSSINAINCIYDGSTLSICAVDGDKNAFLQITALTNFDDDGNEFIESFECGYTYKAKADLSGVTSVAANSLDEEYYVLFNNKIGCYNNIDEKMKYIDASALPHNSGIKFSYSKLYVTPTANNIYAFGKNGKSIDVYGKNRGYAKTVNSLKITFSAPNDMLYKNNFIYILDSGNSRVIKLDKNLTKIIKIYSTFYNNKQGFLTFYGAQGLTVDDKENIFIADTENERVLLSDNKGNVNHIITRPDEQLADTKSPFRATKVMLDRKNLLYIVCETINLGAFQYNLDGEFLSFFGSNTVVQTATVILNYVRKRFMTKEQIKALEQATPISITNMDIDDKGFIYTVTSTDQKSKNDDYTGMIRKLNFQGKDIFTLSSNSKGFGDIEWDRQSVVTNTSFIDVDVDDQGYINLIDFARGKIFQYSSEGDLITVFGRRQTKQLGTFEDAVAIESVDGKIYILDKVSNNISVFKPTAYALALRKAYLMLDSSDADAALDAWKTVLSYNTNSQYPYYGMGRAYEMKGDYENAMKYFKLADAKEEYSKSFKEYRKQYTSDNILWMALVAIVVIALIVVLVRVLKKKLVAKHGSAYSPLETKWGLPIYVLLHPVDGFEQFRTRKIYSIPIALGLVVAWFLVNVVEFFLTGFAFNENRAVDYDLIANLFGTFGLFILFIIANWAICTLSNGKGKMKDIVCVTGYALTPMLITKLIAVVLSNTMTLEEGAFITIITTLGLIWSAIILLLGLYTVHQYSFGGTIGSVILTVLGMAVIALLVVLFFTLLQQCFSFITSIITELKLR